MRPNSIPMQPSRMGNRLIYPDGRQTLLDGTPCAPEVQPPNHKPPSVYAEKQRTKEEALLATKSHPLAPIGSMRGRKLTEKQVRAIKKALAAGATSAALAKKYNVAVTTVKAIKQGKSWKHVTI